MSSTAQANSILTLEGLDNSCDGITDYPLPRIAANHTKTIKLTDIE